MSSKHLNQAELAERWGVSEATLERWRSDGNGPIFMKLHGRVLYRIDDVEQHEIECRHKSTSAKAVTEVAK